MIIVKRATYISGAHLTEKERTTLREAAVIVNDLAGSLTNAEQIIGNETNIKECELAELENIFLRLSNAENVEVGMDWDE